METVQEKIDKIKWWHSIDLGNGIITKGTVDHCSEEIATKRFGIPENLSGNDILDIGCADGYFSFLAERRGAKYVNAIDAKGCFNNDEAIKLAIEILESKVVYKLISLQDFYNYLAATAYNICFYFGVLYHVENPILELKYLSSLTKDYALIETAISNKEEVIWELKPNHENDPTNLWYPSIEGLVTALKYVGFKQTELLYTDGIRATIKAIK